MKETEVLKKLDYFKQAIIRLKEERDYWKQKAEENPEEIISLEDLKTSYELLSDDAKMLKDEIDVLNQENIELKKQLKNSDKKYTEEDLKKLLEKANKKSKEKIVELQEANKDYEATCDKLREENNGLEITNKNLERKLKEITAEKEIDQVLHGEITESEIDNVLKEGVDKPIKVVKITE